MARKNAKTEGEALNPRVKDDHEGFVPTAHMRPLTNDPNKTAFENGVPCAQYAQRVLSVQSPTEPATIKIGNVERALRGQGYPLPEIRETLEPIYTSLMGR